MKRLPALTAKQVIHIIRKLGFIEHRRRGSHAVFFNPQTQRRTVIPCHAGKTIKRPLLYAIIHDDLRITVEEFLKLL